MVLQRRVWSTLFGLAGLTMGSSSCGEPLKIREPAPRSVVVCDDFNQTVYWGPDKNEDWIRVLSRVREADGTWDKVEHIYHAPFEVQSVAGRQSDEFYVAGRSSTGEDVIERWRLSTNQGACFFDIETTASPIGVSAPALPRTSRGIVGGGAYVSSATRRVTPEVERQELCRGFEFGGVVDLSPDPEGRFVIVLGKAPRALYRLPIAAGAVPTLVFTSADLPLLARTDQIYRRQHPTDGRTYVLRGDARFLPGVFHLALFDRDNDGEFEEARELDEAECKAGVWLTDFTTYASPR